MEEDIEKRLYKIVQIISTLIVLNFSGIALGVGNFVLIVFAIFTYLMAGIPARKMSKLMIRIGDCIKLKFLKVLYYVLGLPGFSFLLSWGTCIIIAKLCTFFSKPEKYGYRGLFFMVLFWGIAIVTICLPYLETLILFLLKRILQPKSDSKQ